MSQRSPEKNASYDLLDLLQAFKEGLRESSVRTFVAPVLIAFLQLFFVCLYVNEETVMRSPSNFWVSGESDWDGYATVRALQIKLQRRESDVPLVVATGDSMMLENFEDPFALPSQFRDRGLEVEVAWLATDGQTILETIQLLDQLPPNTRGALVIGINPMMMSHGRDIFKERAENPRLALTSRSLRDEMASLGLEPAYHTGIHTLDHSHFFTARVANLRWWLKGGASPNPHYATETYSRWTAQDWEQKQSKLHRLIQPQNLKPTEEILGRCLERLQNRHPDLSIALLEASLHPRTEEILGEDYVEYRQRMQEFADEHSVAYWIFQDEAQFDPEDYFDFGHVDNASARERYQRILCRRVAELLRESEQEG